MREIKFRAWDIKNNGFVAGFNMVNYHSYFNADLKPSIYRYGSEWVDGEYILEQYTGLKDKNGREIYEGDICNCHIFTQELGGNMGVVEGEKEFVCSMRIYSYGVVLWRGNLNSGPIWSYCGFHEESLEVIGNIHENPELLPT